MLSKSRLTPSINELIISTLFKEEKQKEPRDPNSSRLKRKKTKSPTETSDSDNLPELVEKSNNEGHQLSELEKGHKSITS